MIEGVMLLLPMGIAFIFGEKDYIWFIITAVPSMGVGALMYFLVRPEKKNMHAVDGFLTVAFAWIVMSAVAAVPFVISGTIPNFIDALFETVSGFTTTGCTALTDVEALSQSMLFWRSFTNWVGGMGILVFMLAISPVAGGGSAMHMLRAESPGPVTEKISPKISTTAKYLYLIYIGFTVIEIIALSISGMSVFHSSLISFATMATGGFSYLNTSIAAMTYAQQSIITVFMVLAGVNFSLYYLVLTGKGIAALKNEEFRWYLILYFGSVAVITLNVCLSVTGQFHSVGETIHYVLFTMASVITTTGFSVCDINGWPWFAKNLIMLIMFFGACAGSTAGGIKLSRIIIALKHVKNRIVNLFHPRSVGIVRFGGKDVGEDVIKSVSFYILLFVVLFAVSMVIVSFDPLCDFTTAFSAVDTTISNNGIGLGAAGGSFSVFSWYSKIVFIIDMLIGRLEIFPIVVFFGWLLSPVSKGAKAIRKRARAR